MEYKFPFRIGIIGHQSLTEVEKGLVAKEINRYIGIIQRSVEDRRKAAKIKTGFFISGITSVAEGANRVFATQFINYPANIEVVLPFNRQIYQQDFWGEESKTEFTNILKFDLYPVVYDNSAEPEKEWCYYQTAKLIIAQCDILLVVWDESPAKNNLAGIQHLIEYSKQQRVPVAVLHPRPNQQNEKENKENIDAVSLNKYLDFDTRWAHLSNEAEGAANEFTAVKLNDKPIPDEEFNKLSKLINANSVFNKLSKKDEAPKENASGWPYMLVLLICLGGLVQFTFTYFTGSLFNFLLPPAAAFNLQGLLHTISVVSVTLQFALSFILILVVFNLQISSRRTKTLYSRYWAFKTRWQLLRLLVLPAGSEVLKTNDVIAANIWNTLEGRLYLVLSKDAWNSFINPLSLTDRSDILKAEIELQIKIDQVNATKTEKYQGAIWLLSALSVLIMICSACLLAGHLNKFINLPFNLPVYIGKLSPVLLLLPLSVISLMAWRGFSRIGIHTTRKNLQPRLNGVLECFPDLCSSEKELENLFLQAEGILGNF